MRPIRGGWVLGAVLLAGVAGCETLNPRTVQIDAASGRFQAAQLTYQLDTGRLSQPVQTARIEGQQVSYQQLPSSPLPNRSQARLSVQYPHPRGKAGFALAEVVIESDGRPEKSDSGAGKSTFQRLVGSFTDAMNDIFPGMTYNSGVREAWAMDVSKEELDQLLGGLANSGYFQYGPAPTPGIEVFTKLDGKIIRKNWRQVPELDAFIERVRHEGQLVSYVRPLNSQAAPADIAGGRSDSVAAYQQQLQRQQAGPAPPPQPFPIANAPAANPYGPPRTSQPYGKPAPPQYGNQRYASQSYGGPQYGNPRYGNSQYGNPQYGVPPAGNPSPPAAASQPNPQFPSSGAREAQSSPPPQAYPQSWPMNQHSARGDYPY